MSRIPLSMFLAYLTTGNLECILKSRQYSIAIVMKNPLSGDIQIQQLDKLPKGL